MCVSHVTDIQQHAARPSHVAHARPGLALAARSRQITLALTGGDALAASRQEEAVARQTRRSAAAHTR